MPILNKKRSIECHAIHMKEKMETRLNIIQKQKTEKRKYSLNFKVSWSAMPWSNFRFQSQSLSLFDSQTNAIVILVSTFWTHKHLFVCLQWISQSTKCDLNVHYIQEASTHRPTVLVRTKMVWRSLTLLAYKQILGTCCMQLIDSCMHTAQP